MSKLSKTYLCYTFFILLMGWGTCLLCSLYGLSLNDYKLLYVPYLLGGWSPTIASYLALKKYQRIADLKAWLKHVFDFKHGAFSYIMVVVLAMISIIPRCFISGYENGAPIFMIIVLVPIMIFGGGLEEAGWRYVLQPELEKVHSFTVSTVLTAIIWWLWHLPLFFIQGVVQYGQNYLAFGINVLGLSFALASIRKNTNSVGLCLLFHCLENALSAIFIIHDAIWGSIAATVFLILCSYALVRVNSRKKIFH